MKDDRVRVFRNALRDLIESLHATVRVNRWAGPDSVPEPLEQSAAQLMVRLGTADRLSSSKFNGSSSDKEQVTAMCASMRRLDAAYLLYRQQVERAPSDKEAASMALDAEIDEVKNASAQGL